jgi:nucleoside phosphorylase
MVPMNSIRWADCKIATFETPAHTTVREYQNSLLLRVLQTFREIVDALEDAEPDRDLRKFYVRLNAYSLLLTEDISPVLYVDLTPDLQSLVFSLLGKFASFMQFSVMPDYERTLPVSDPFPRLVTLAYYWGLSDLDEKLIHIRRCVDFNPKEQRDEMILLLRRCVETVQSQDSESLADQDEYRPPRKKRKAASSMCLAANSAFQVLAVSSRACQCSSKHNYTARLRLKTYHKKSKGQYAFNAFINPGEANKFWQETQIQAILSNNESLRPSRVRFTGQQDSSINRNGRKDRPRLLLRDLCEHIEKSKSRPLMRLNLVVENGRLWKDASSRSEFPISRSDLPLSLKEIIAFHPVSLTEKVKRVLAVLLASSVFHLDGTPWMRHIHFNASNIMFFRTTTAVPLKPYINVELIESDPEYKAVDAFRTAKEFDDEIDPDNLPIHPFPDIVMLATMLMELYMVQPIRSLGEQASFGLDHWDDIDDNMRYLTAVAVFEKFKADLSENFREAVERCLDQNIAFDRKDNMIDDEGIKRIIYEGIVLPLEEELDQGFGSIVPIDNLDEVAQTLDLNSWGQKKSNNETASVLFDRVEYPNNSPGALRNTFSSLSESSFRFNSTLENENASHDFDHSPLSFQEKLYRSQSEPNKSGNSTPPLTHRSYTVGWICALPEEMAVVQEMLDEIHSPLPRSFSDQNSYTLGRIGMHNVVIACHPAKVIGTVSAARVSEHMLCTFKHIKFGLLVGIGGGVPGAKDIRLGNVVVGEPSELASGESIGGVIQYDFGKTIEGGTFSHKGSLNRPPDVLVTAVSLVKENHYRDRPRFENYMKQMIMENPRLDSKFSSPSPEHDLLFEHDYSHCPQNDEESCKECDSNKLVQRRPRKQSSPQVYYGLIASGNQVMRDGNTRDRLGKKLGVLCFEMEAAEIVDAFPCLVIRGICDYADSHKNKIWQGYAASAAAAYAKELLSVISAREMESVERSSSIPRGDFMF